MMNSVRGLIEVIESVDWKKEITKLQESAPWRELKALLLNPAEPEEPSICGDEAGCTVKGLCTTLEDCKYACVGGPLRLNKHWQELKRRARKCEERRAEELEGLESGRGDDDLEAVIRKVESLYAGEVDPIRQNDFWRELKLRMRKWREKETADAIDLGRIAAMAVGHDNSRMEKGARMFHDVLQRVCAQVFSGKGEKRHGLGRPLLEQPAFQVRKRCEGFLMGQALKKIMEAQEAPLDFEGRMQELIGAVAYLVFEIVYTEA